MQAASRGLLWLCEGRGGTLCSRHWLWVCLFSRQVPRTFVNLVTVLSITSLRELYAEKNVSCPRILMRSEDDLFYSSHCCSQRAGRSPWGTFLKGKMFYYFVCVCTCTYTLISTWHLGIPPPFTVCI